MGWIFKDVPFISHLWYQKGWDYDRSQYHRFDGVAEWHVKTLCGRSWNYTISGTSAFSQRKTVPKKERCAKCEKIAAERATQPVPEGGWPPLTLATYRDET